MKIAVEGCAHGELEIIYDTIAHIESRENVKVDLLICCGDFQSVRNPGDLNCMAVPQNYRNMCSFYKYYSGEKLAPILTIFIGGNHEASNYLQELPYGGWVAPNIYYLGYSGVVNVAGIRIGGLSGIYKGRDFNRGRFEKSPYDASTVRSVYHIRNLDVFRLRQLTNKIDVILSHDWPRGIYHYGNAEQLIRHKPFFADEIVSNSLGNPPCEELLKHLKPTYWFAAHLHTKFSAVVPHDIETGSSTRFLALDKCLPRRRFLQLIDMDHDISKNVSLEYDLQWLAILYLTNHLVSVKNISNYMPGQGNSERWIFTPTKEEQDFVLKKFNGDLTIPLNFVQTSDTYSSNSEKYQKRKPTAQNNPQTIQFCDTLGIDDPLALLLLYSNDSFNTSSASNMFTTPDKNTFTSFTSSQSNTESPLASLLPTPKWVGDEQTITPKRLSMSLPCPRAAENNSVNSKLETPSPEAKTDVTMFDELKLSTSSEPDVKLDSSETSSIFFTDISGDLNYNDNIDKAGNTPAKKFKRRNESFYNSTD